MVCGSTLYNCTERGHSPAPGAIMRKVSGRLSIKARAVTISDTNNPAPCSRQSARKAELVIPAIGARTTGGSITWSPLASGRVNDTG